MPYSFHYEYVGLPARPPGAALGARALATRLYPTFSSTATRIARRGATRNALSPPQTAHTILLISVCRVGAKTGIGIYRVYTEYIR